MASWEENVRKVNPYVPGEQPKEKNIIKLNTNENPYGPSPKVREAVFDFDDLRKYPDPTVSLLVEKLAAYHHTTKDRVFVGVGSDDVIAMAFMTFFNSKKPVLFPDISYSFYPVWANMLGIKYELVPVDAEFNIVKEDYYKENGGIIFPNPNAPTSKLVSRDFIIDILKANKDSVVIIDEAYIDFAKEGSSVIDLTEEYDNLLCVRTFSKSRSLAGMRIGYAVGNAKLIKYMNDVKYSYNSYTMNTPSILYGVASVEDDEYFKETVKKIVDTRERFVREIKNLGFLVLPSAANFVFAKHPDRDAANIFEAAKKNGIYFRYFKQDRIRDYLRITIGTDEEMDKVIEFFKSYLN